MKTSRFGWAYPQLWALTRERAVHAREEYRRGARMVDLVIKYKVSYGTIQSVIAGRHASVRGLPNIARERGPK